uniref:Cytochrome b6-f complex subunit 6 n=1 Tax=Streptosarcina moshanensis TaxID=3096259 RepID=A0AAU7VAT9_9VIRI|nr:subunit VI of cytochrome b6/f complex [Streptosarcina arenaria]YP_010933493.1 subunit VI of cytochrome b6/f complex [Streptosarcina costaricana]WKT08894.1 subunit VI of cytochrome b6/f complex [Streptosarcina arenaria]WKT08998.1 subunit VI of cytochrome b6/f complex [Streptosarcina costaricana]
MFTFIAYVGALLAFLSIALVLFIGLTKIQLI